MITYREKSAHLTRYIIYIPSATYKPIPYIHIYIFICYYTTFSTSDSIILNARRRRIFQYGHYYIILEGRLEKRMKFSVRRCDRLGSTDVILLSCIWLSFGYNIVCCNCNAREMIFVRSSKWSLIMYVIIAAKDSSGVRLISNHIVLCTFFFIANTRCFFLTYKSPQNKTLSYKDNISW